MLSIAKQSLALTKCLPKTCTVSCSVKVYIHQESHLFWVLMVPNYSLKPYKTNESLSFPFCISFKPHFIAQKLLVLHQIIKFSQFYYIRKQLIRYILFPGYFSYIPRVPLERAHKCGSVHAIKIWEKQPGKRMGAPRIFLKIFNNHD